MQLLPMASSPNGLISAQYVVITKTPGWEVGVVVVVVCLGVPGTSRCLSRHRRAATGAPPIRESNSKVQDMQQAH